jgi:hypothetical protein
VQDSGRRVIKVLDGQHTAIAAASNPHVSTIPIVVVNAPTTPDQAAAFVGQNTEKLGVTALHLYRASLLAGEENAMDVQGVCKRAGIVVLKTPPSGSKYNARETIAITTIRALVRRHSVMGARKILQVLANADLAPIEAMHIKAAELLLTNPEFCNKIDPADLTATIIATYVDADDEARNLGYSHRMPVWHALALVWFRKTRKKRGALRIAA